MNKQRLKVFIAFNIPTHNSAGHTIHFDNVQQQIQQLIPSFRPYAAFHSTIAFVGYTSFEQLTNLKQMCTQAINNFKKIKNDPGITGLSISDGVVLYGKNAIGLNIIGNEAVLKTFLHLLHDHLVATGILLDDKNQHLPLHITLGRYNTQDFDKNRITDALVQISSPEGAQAALDQTFTIKTMTLYESLPGSKYNSLEIYHM